jgi:predicted GNAT family acetyltransferase
VGTRLGGTGTGLLVWDDDGPVSLAGWAGGLPTGSASAPSTPAGPSGRGYAGALVAALSAIRLAEGSRFCFLYTDLANPTSTRLYAELGYEPACDSRQYAFDT